MDFDLSEDQRALQDAAARFLDEQCPTTRVRAAMASDEAYDRDLWLAMIDLGWPAMAVPEDQGGLGLGSVELAVLLEQTGAHVAPTPFLQEVLVLDALVGAAARGVEDAGWLDPVLQGDTVVAVAWQPLHAERDGARWLLSGRTGPALFAPIADVLVVPGREADGTERLFAVSLTSRAIAPEPAMDQTRQLGWVELEATAALHLGGSEAADAFFDLGALAHAAELLGAASRVLDLTVEYAKERVQFGRPIGSFQAVKHHLADARLAFEFARPLVYRAAWSLATHDAERGHHVAMAKAQASDAALLAGRVALQCHGAIGYTTEYDLHLFMKRAWALAASWGDAAWHRASLGRAIL